MSKVLIDRALLERVQERLDPHRDAVLWGDVCDTFRSAPSGTPAMPVKAYYHEWTDLEGVRTRSVGLEVRKEFTDAPLVLEADALARIACLEGEIATRDARIVELEADLAGTQSRVLVLQDQWRQIDAELAAIKAQEPVCYTTQGMLNIARENWNGVQRIGAHVKKDHRFDIPLYAAPVSEAKAQGVVMPERWNVPRPMWKDARQPYGNPLNHADIEAAEKFNLALDEVARLNASHVQQVSAPASAFASRAITHYEAALLAAFPSGSSGEVFNQWNEARHVLAAAPAVPSQGEQVRVVPVEPTEAMRKAAQDKLASEGLIVTDWLIHTAYSAMLANAPSPAGVDGLEVEAYLHTMHMEIGQTRQFCSKWKGDPFGIAGEDYSSTYAVTSDPLCRLSDAQAIIDGLRGEVADLRSMLATVSKAGLRGRTERDQQALRIGELEGLLRSCLPALSDGGCAALANRIDAAMSAGKEGE